MIVGFQIINSLFSLRLCQTDGTSGMSPQISSDQVSSGPVRQATAANRAGESAVVTYLLLLITYYYSLIMVNG